MRTKQVRPQPKDYEYELHISRNMDKTKEKEYILFDFRTTKIFEYYKYKINVFEKFNLSKNEIGFRIEGLSAPSTSLSNPGYASYQYKFFDFKNIEYDLKFIKPGTEKTVFKLKVSKNNIKISRQPSKRFLEIITN